MSGRHAAARRAPVVFSAIYRGYSVKYAATVCFLRYCMEVDF